MVKGKREGLLIAGGGLAGCLAALAMATRRPEPTILLVEEGESFGGNHIWSFFDEDLEESGRKLKAGYNSVRSDQLDQVVRQTMRRDQYRLGTKIVAVRDNELVLGGGEK